MAMFVVEYTLGYEHIVRVGVTARSEEQAIKKAQAAFDAGAIWDDTAEMQLLFDDYEETDSNVLEFRPTKVGEFPEVDRSVIAVRRNASFYGTLERLKMLRDLAINGECQESLADILTALVCDLEKLK